MKYRRFYRCDWYSHLRCNKTIKLGPNLKRYGADKMRWGYEGISREDGTVKICHQDCINLDKPLLEVCSLDDAAKACKEYNKIAARATEAEKLLQTLLADMQDWSKDGIPVEYLVDMHDSRRFLGGGKG